MFLYIHVVLIHISGCPYLFILWHYRLKEISSKNTFSAYVSFRKVYKLLKLQSSIVPSSSISLLCIEIVYCVLHGSNIMYCL